MSVSLPTRQPACPPRAGAERFRGWNADSGRNQSGSRKLPARAHGWMGYMSNRVIRIDLVKLAVYVLKHIWLIFLCAAVGFYVMYSRSAGRGDTYTSYGTMYVNNSNPQMVNYGYASMADLTSAVQLINTYSVVVKSERVMSQVLDSELDVLDEQGQPTGEKIRLSEKYPELNTSLVSALISMSSVNETGMVRVSCTSENPEKSRDICNAVLLQAPQVIVDVVGAGQAQMIDSATYSRMPNPRGERRQGMIGAIMGGSAACVLLVLLCLLRQKVTDTKELEERYTPPVLSSIKRNRRENKDPAAFLLSETSDMEITENYAKLRINLFYSLIEKKSNVVEITSAISGEGKSTIAANLALSCAMSGKRVLLIDADMRRACQHEVFHYDDELPGLSDVLAEIAVWRDVVIPSGKSELLSVMPAGHIPPNPSELLESGRLRALLGELSAEYDLVLLDVPPINIVADPLALAGEVAGSIFVVRQGFSTHREVSKALVSAEMTGMMILGFVFYGENVSRGSYYSKRHYKNYYHRYDTRSRSEKKAGRAAENSAGDGEAGAGKDA